MISKVAQFIRLMQYQKLDVSLKRFLNKLRHCNVYQDDIFLLRNLVKNIILLRKVHQGGHLKLI